MFGTGLFHLNQEEIRFLREAHHGRFFFLDISRITYIYIYICNKVLPQNGSHTHTRTRLQRHNEDCRVARYGC